MALLVSSCVPVNQYGTARTVPDGEVAGTVAPEVWTYRRDDPRGDPDDDRLGVTMFMPSVHARLGLADRLDLGAHVYELVAPGVDLKGTLIKTRVFDLALQPGARGVIGDPPLVALGGPLILDLNASRELSFVLTSGAEVLAGALSSALYTAGGGVDIRVSKKLAIHPEVTIARRFVDAEGTFVMGGIGFTSGTLPSFDDD